MLTQVFVSEGHGVADVEGGGWYRCLHRWYGCRCRTLLGRINQHGSVGQDPLRTRALILDTKVFLAQLDHAPWRQCIDAVIEEADGRALMQMAPYCEDAGKIGQQLIDDQVELVEIDAGACRSMSRMREFMAAFY